MAGSRDPDPGIDIPNRYILNDLPQLPKRLFPEYVNVSRSTRNTDHFHRQLKIKIIVYLLSDIEVLSSGIILWQIHFLVILCRARNY